MLPEEKARVKIDKQLRNAGWDIVSRNEYLPNSTSAIIPWLKTGDLNDGMITDIPEYITELALKETSVKLNPVGSVLIAMYGATIGKLGILEVEATTNQACCACSTYEGIYNKYLFYYLMSQRDRLRYMGSGGAQSNISKENIVGYCFPLAPYAEQIRVVNAIETIFAELDKIEKLQLHYSVNLEILKSKIINAGIQGKLTEQLPEDGTAEELLEQIAEEKKQLIKEKKIKATKALPEITEDEIPFEIPENWKWVRLADICSKITSGNTPAGGSKGGAYVTEGNCFFREQNIYNDGIHYEGMVYITDELLATRGNSTVLPQDILLNITGGSIGRCALIPDDFSKGSINQHILIIRVIEPEIRQYIHKCLCSPYYQKLIMGNVVGDKDGFYCTQCGGRGIPVHRKYGQFREVGHLKKLYCLACGKETNHAECISASKYDSSMFFEEYESGNFDSEGNRILSLSEWKQKKQEPESIVDIDQEDDLSEWYELFNIAVEGV